MINNVLFNKLATLYSRKAVTSKYFNYGCAKCEKLFTQSSTRNNHLRTHKGLSIEQQSELKFEIPRSIVYDYLNYDKFKKKKI